ncbi:MAG: hypothetical protein AB8G17_05090 [Gammaproteobacteria bacterium]
MLRKIAALLAALVPSFAAASDTARREMPDDLSLFKIRLYVDGRLTLNNEDMSIEQLSEPLTSAAADGAVAWIYLESPDMQELPKAEEVLKVLASANLPFLFSSDEDYSDVSAEKNPDVGPTNVLLYQSQEEYEQFVGSEHETMSYLAKLELSLIASLAQSHEGFFHVVVALRPGESKIWLLHPDHYTPDDFQSLVSELESQTPPTIRGGVLAFAISRQFPAVLGEQPAFEPPVPPEWAEAAKKADRESTATEILNSVWPPR